MLNKHGLPAVNEDAELVRGTSRETFRPLLRLHSQAGSKQGLLMKAGPSPVSSRPLGL